MNIILIKLEFDRRCIAGESKKSERIKGIALFIFEERGIVRKMEPLFVRKLLNEPFHEEKTLILLFFESFDEPFPFFRDRAKNKTRRIFTKICRRDKNTET